MRRSSLIVLVLALIAFACSLIVSGTVFERVPHLEDEVAYLFQAKVFARGQITAPLIEPSGAYWQPFVIDDTARGVRFGKYPPGWPLLLGIGVMLGLPAVVNAALAALNVAIVYRIGRDAFSEMAGVYAAALLAFSPMALLLNATLMAHTAGLLCASLFIWAYLRMSRADPRRWTWGLAGGLSLGLLAATRPLSAVAVALPFVIWSGLRLLFDTRTGQPRKAIPLFVLAGGALLTAALVPVYNAATTGDPSANLYTLVPGWEYDRIGFGPEVGRNGHTLTKGIQFARYDLSLTAADLFGWQLAGWSEMLSAWVVGIAPDGMVADSWWPAVGVGWLLVPVGLLMALRRDWAYLWVLAGVLWVLLVDRFLFDAPGLWGAVMIAWALMPLLWIGRRPDSIDHAHAGWLLFGVLFALIAAHTAYWIGSQRYGTRYYAEGLSAAAVLAALPLAALTARGGLWRRVVPVVFSIALGASALGYSAPRIDALRGFNRVTSDVLAGVEARRESPDTPVLVLVSGRDARWRTRAALWTVASPFLDGDIEVALVNETSPQDRSLILARFPGRQVIEMAAQTHDLWFVDTCDADDCPLANPPVNPSLLQSVSER